MTNKKKDILLKIFIAILIIATYFLGGYLLIKPDEKGINLFLWFFFGFLVSVLVGLITLIGSLTTRKEWTSNIYFVTSTLANLLLSIFTLTIADKNWIYNFIYYLGPIIGIYQSILLTKHFLKN